MDAYGHINNVQVLRLLEEARIQAFGPPAGTGAEGQPPRVELFSTLDATVQALVAEHRVRYLAALEYRNIPLCIDVWVSAVKGASLTLDYVISDPVTFTHCVKATTVLVFVNVANGAVQRLTDRQRELTAVFLGDPVFG